MKYLIIVIMKADVENAKKNKQQRHIIFFWFLVLENEGSNNSWQLKGLKRIEFYKYFGEKGA